MGSIKMPPVGVEFFSQIRSGDYYYVDKTGLVIDLINLKNEVTIFTRPRRFGKSLNMDMLKSFFEIGSDINLFKGLKISEEKELCGQYQGKFPVISISLKDVDGRSYDEALMAFSQIIIEEVKRFKILLKSEKLDEFDKNELKNIITNSKRQGDLRFSLRNLSRLLYLHYSIKPIILIDEYDVPLDKAYQNGYYNEMVQFIRLLFSSALKSNEYLGFAVLTGCLRIARESIFTGLNNFEVYSVQDKGFSGYFGFTASEVGQMLKYYGLKDKADLFKEWYDGYSFGGTDVYCPWDVINQCKRFYISKDTPMQPHWANSSSNSIIRDIINEASATTKEKIEALVSGESITQEIIQEMTYSDLDSADRQDYLWSLLYYTGYLTDVSVPEEGVHTLVIPDMEIHKIYEKQVLSWFRKKSIKSMEWGVFCEAVENGEVKKTEELLNNFMSGSISIRDTCSRKDLKENFYHGLLLGLLKPNDSWVVKSNSETGTGYADILIKAGEKKTGCVFELKYTESKDKMDAACKAAIQQIKEKGYEDILKQDGMETIYCYGIAFYKKMCKVICL